MKRSLYTKIAHATTRNGNRDVGVVNAKLESMCNDATHRAGQFR